MRHRTHHNLVVGRPAQASRRARKFSDPHRRLPVEPHNPQAARKVSHDEAYGVAPRRPKGFVGAHGAVDLATIQRYLNFWFTSSLDLFGSEVSSNAATSFANGIKGRPDEDRYDDHICAEATLQLETPDGTENISLRNAMNEVMRDSYIKDCEIGLKRWNMQIKRAGYDTFLRLPSKHFRRTIGRWAGVPVDPDGKLLDRQDYDKRLSDWLPSESDRAFVHSLMQRVVEPGKMASWIAPPDRGINKLPVDYEYVRLH